MKRNTGPDNTRGMMGFFSVPVDDPVAAWREALEKDALSPRTLYIHIPFCRSRCPFCPFYLGAAAPGEMEEYVNLLVRELERWGKEAGRFPVNAVYFGGGTPSDLTSGQFVAILDALHHNYRLAADCEITVEGRIDGLDAKKVRTLAANGVNRLSVGVQTFDTELRRRLGRQSDRATVLARLEELAKLNELAVVIDLLYGLPGQTLADLREDLDLLFSSTQLSGLDLYRLRVGETLPLAKLIAAGKLPATPGEEEAFEMFQLGVERMRAEGAVRLSPLHFAFDARERNLNNTVSGAKNVCLPFGMKAGGRLAGFRFSQHTGLADYRRAVEAGEKPLASAGVYPPDFAACGALSGQIYRRMQVDPVRVAEAAPVAVRDAVRRNLERGADAWKEQGYLTSGGNGVFSLTERANFSHRRMAADLMERIAEAFE